MIDLDWYRSFVAVYRAGTVSGAALALFLTQPAITQHLARLEAAVGEPLFIRTPRRMLPTERGKLLYVEVVGSLEKLEQVSQTLRQASVEQPLLKLGTPLEYFNEVALAQLAGADLRLWVQFGDTPYLLECLERRELDAVIATQRVSRPGLEYVKLADENFVLVARPDLKISGENIESELTAQRWISYGTELPIIRRFWQSCFNKRPDFQPAVVLPNLQAICRAVALGYGVSLLPDYLCRKQIAAGQLQVLWQPPQPVTNELWLAYRRADRARLELQAVRAKMMPKS